MLRNLFIVAVAVAVLAAAGWLTLFLLVQAGFGDTLPYQVRQYF